MEQSTKDLFDSWKKFVAALQFCKNAEGDIYARSLLVGRAYKIGAGDGSRTRKIFRQTFFQLSFDIAALLPKEQKVCWY